MADISEWPTDKLEELFEIIQELDGWGLVITDDELLLSALGLPSDYVIIPDTTSPQDLQIDD